MNPGHQYLALKSVFSLVEGNISKDRFGLDDLLTRKMLHLLVKKNQFDSVIGCVLNFPFIHEQKGRALCKELRNDYK